MAQSVTPLVAPRPQPPATIGELLGREDETRNALAKVATRYLPADRALRLAITAVRRTRNLAACDPTSFMGSLIGATGLGLEPNTPKGHAFLIPYKQRKPRRDQNNVIMKDGDGKWLWDEYWECQLQIGYKGFVALFYRNAIIKSVQAEAIYAGDKFQHRFGTETFLSYEKNLQAPRGPDQLAGAFCFTALADGQAFTILNRDDVLKIRAKSQTYTTLLRNVEDAEAAVANNKTERNQRDLNRALITLADTPWVMWEDQMSAKTAIKRHGKQQDLGAEIAAAADIDTLADTGTLDLHTFAADPEAAREILQGGDEVPQTQADDDVAEQDQTQQTTAADPTSDGGERAQQPSGTRRQQARRLFTE